MIENDEVLESMQSDILGLLQNSHKIKGHVFKDNEGDFESRLEKSLGTKTAGAEGKRGLAVIVLQVDVTDAEKNLPGPPLKMRARVLIIENIVTNRSATKGTLQRSSQAALNVLSALHLAGFGAYSLYADNNPIAPQTAPEGVSSHMVTLYCSFHGLGVTAKPLGVTAEMTEGGDILDITGNMTVSGQPLVFPPLLSISPDPGGPKPQYTNSGDYENGDISMRWYEDDGGFWFLQYEGIWAWMSTDDVATPDLVTTWSIHPDFDGGGTLAGLPVIDLTPGGGAAMSLTCESPSSSIYYTTDGSYPSPSAGTLYTTPITGLEAGTVVRAAAYVADQAPGDVLELTVTA